MIEKRKSFVEQIFRTPKNKNEIILGIGIIITVIIMLGIRGVSDKMQYDKNRLFLNVISKLNAAEVERIEINKIMIDQSNEYNQFISELTTKDEKSDFLIASNDLTIWKPNHPLDKGILFISVKLFSGMEYSFEIRQPITEEKIFHIYCKSNSGAFITLESSNLVFWSEKYVK